MEKKSMERFETKVAVFVILENQLGEILLQQRHNTGYLDGYYDCSASGHLEKEETILQAATREAKEELGVTIDENDLQLVHIGQYDAETQYISFIYLCRIWQGEPEICEPDKASDLKYFPTESLPEKCTVSLRVLEESGFIEKITYSYVSKDKLEQLVRVKD